MKVLYSILNDEERLKKVEENFGISKEQIQVIVDKFKEDSEKNPAQFSEKNDDLEGLGELSFSFLEKIIPFLVNNKKDMKISKALLNGFVSDINEHGIKDLNKFLNEYYPELTFIQSQKIMEKIETHDAYTKEDYLSMQQDQYYPDREFNTLDIQDLYDALLEVGIENNDVVYSVKDFIEEYQIKSLKFRLK